MEMGNLVSVKQVRPFLESLIDELNCDLSLDVEDLNGSRLGKRGPHETNMTTKAKT
jgi:hypothetical protein